MSQAGTPSVRRRAARGMGKYSLEIPVEPLYEIRTQIRANAPERASEGRTHKRKSIRLA